MEFILTGSPDARLCLQRAISRACLLKDIGRGDGDGPSLHGVRKTLHCSIVLEGLWLPEGMVPRNQRLAPDHQNHRSGGRYDAFGLRPRLSGVSWLSCPTLSAGQTCTLARRSTLTDDTPTVILRLIQTQASANPGRHHAEISK